jgi:hypothetical protein
LVRKRRTRRKLRRRSTDTRTSPISTKLPVSIPSVRLPEILVYLTGAAPFYFGFWALPVDTAQKASLLQVHAVMIVCGLVNLLQVRMVTNAARNFASHARVWYFFGYAAHQLIVSSATMYWLLSHSIGNSFSSSSGPGGLTRIEALYLAVTTFTTTGYGDVEAVTTDARLLVCGQGVVGFALLLILAFVLVRGAVVLLKEDSATRAIRARVGRVRGYSSLRPWDRFTAIGVMPIWVFILARSTLTLGHGLQVWQWFVLVLGLCLPTFSVVRIIHAIFDPHSAVDRVRYLFAAAIAGTVCSNCYAYWLISHTYPAFHDPEGTTGLTMLDSFGFAVGTLITRAYPGVSPVTDSARALIILQQVTTFVLFSVVLAFVNARWEPAQEVQTGTLVRRRKRVEIPIKGDL